MGFPSTSVKLKWILITAQLTIETLAWRRALFSSSNCLQRSLQVSSSIFKTLFSCFRRAMRFFSLWATDDELSSALISLSLNPVPSIEELNELAILETHSSHKALREVIKLLPRRGRQVSWILQKSDRQTRARVCEWISFSCDLVRAPARSTIPEKNQWDSFDSGSFSKKNKRINKWVIFLVKTVALCGWGSKKTNTKIKFIIWESYSSGWIYLRSPSLDFNNWIFSERTVITYLEWLLLE